MVPAAEDRAGHGREQGPGHAEDHGVDVDDVDALQRLAAAQVAHPLLGRLPGAEAGPLGRGMGAIMAGGDEGHHEGAGVDPVDEGEPMPRRSPRVPGRRRSPTWKVICIMAAAAGMLAPLHQAGHRGHAGRVGEAVEGGGQRADQVEREQRGVAGRGVDGQGRAGERRGAGRPQHDAPAVEGVAQRTGHQGAGDEGERAGPG